MESYELVYVLHGPCEDQGWLYMAEAPQLPGCRAWGETANDALTELSAVAEQFILSYKERGKPYPDEIMEELWRIKDDMAREYANDPRKFVAHLQDRAASRTRRHGL